MSRTFRYVGSAVPASNTPAGVLDALYALIAAVSYASGTERIPGDDQALLGNRIQNAGQTESVYAAPATNPHGLKFQWSGDDAAHTPQMIPAPVDTWATNTILFGISRNAGVQAAWDTAQPWSSPFTGYARACALGSHTITRVHLWECSQGFYVIYQTATGSIHNLAGNFINPGVTNGTSPFSAESDGGRLLMFTNGGTTPQTAGSWTTAGSPSLLCHSTTANNQHFFVLSVGGVTLTPVTRSFDTMLGSLTTSYFNRDGDFVGGDIEIHETAAAGGYKIGKLDGMVLGPKAKIAMTITPQGSATINAYAAGTHPSTDNDVLWLQAS